jgi:hypothetical protein
MIKIILAITVLTAFNITSCKKTQVEEIKIPPVIVSDANMNGWVKNPMGLATVNFVKGPSTLLLGTGSVQFITPDKSFARLRDTTHSGIRLADVTELSYSTFIEKSDSIVDNHFLAILLDLDGDGKSDTHIAFDPRYQSGSFVAGSLPDQGITKKNTWQTWDAFHGGWFVGGLVTDDPDHNGWFFNLGTYLNKYPNATIVNDPLKGGGAIRLSVGGPVFSKNFIGYADNFKIGVKGVTTTYDFE